MSKKSKTKRVLHIRDEQKWEEMESMYTTIATGIINYSEELSNSVKTITHYSNGKNDPELIAVVNGFNNDINEFTNELIIIHNKHLGKIGVIKDPNELAECINIFQEYTALFEKFKTVTFNSSLLITEKLSDLRVKLSKESAISDAEIVSDVKKEIVNE